MNYYFCAYGSHIRWSSNVHTADQAARETFGTVNNVTCLAVGSRSPKYFPQKKVKELHQKLAKMHKQKTGNEIII